MISSNKQKRTWYGVAQSDRLKAALLPDYVKIDERKISDLMAFTVELAQHIHFYNQRDEVDGNWVKFFKNDMSFFLASIMATDLKAIEQTRLTILEEINPIFVLERQQNGLKELFRHTFSLAKMLNDWYLTSLRIADRTLQEPEGIEEGLENAITQKLGAMLQELKGYDLGAAKVLGQPVGLDYKVFHDIWGLDKVEEAKELFGDREDTVQQIQVAVKKVRLIYRGIYNSLSFIIHNSASYLEETLESKQNHEPGTALFIAFLKLFAHAKDNLNGMTKKHLDYYYYKILQQHTRAAVPDSVHVFFEAQPKGKRMMLKAGTELSAGRDGKGVDCLFRTEHDLELSKIQLAELKTLFLERNKSIGIGSSYQLITNVYAAPIANSADGKGREFVQGEESWPLFGENQFDKRKDERFMRYADLGFAIASPILALSEGRRRVEMIFRFDEGTTSTIVRLIKDISRNEKIGRKDALVKILQDSLMLEVSSTGLWFEVPTYEVNIPTESLDDFSFSLGFSLLASDPPLCDYDKEMLGDGFDTQLPVVKIKLRSEGSIYAYSFLRDLIVQSVEIKVDVKGIKNLELANDLGKLDATLPFQPFGPTPKLGAYFLLGKAELFRKEIIHLAFNFDWYNLPKDKGGFRNYYQAYGRRVNNEDFLVGLSALSGNEFMPKEVLEQQLFELFETDEQEDTLKESTHFEAINLENLGIKPDYFLGNQEIFDNNTRAGFFKIELTSPEIAFGHAIFPKIFAEVAMENAQQKSFPGLNIGKQVPLREVPEAPFIPMIRKVTLDYSASTEINLLALRSDMHSAKSPDQFYHLHPFGNIRTFHQNRASDRFLLPQFEHHGYLYIGLKNLNPPEKLSLLFQMHEGEEANTFHERPEVVWWYWEEGHWVRISEENILMETTDSFAGTGIVSLKIPQKASKGSGILNSDLHWLRLTIDGTTRAIPHVKAIHTNAVVATWWDNGNSRTLDRTLAPNTIKNLLHPIKSVMKVLQPYPSFGGRIKEDELSFYTRVSERLKHKNRAVNYWDFERLILEKFPQLFQVKCISRRGNEDFISQDNTVMAIIAPKIDVNERIVRPQVGFSRLQEVKGFLTSVASPFTSIEVRNPTYENLKITFGVIFQKGKNNGNYIEKLNKDIRNYVCPWLYSSEKAINIGGSLNKNSLLNFVKNRSYVKFVTRFSIVQIYKDKTGATYEDTARNHSHSPVIQASTPWSVLVPLESHPIVFLERNVYENPEPAAIDSMILETDFILKKDQEEVEKKDEYEDFLLESLGEKKKKDKVYFLKFGIGQ